MSAPSFGWVDILHALSLGLRLRRRAGIWVFDTEFEICGDAIDDLIAKDFISKTDAQDEITITSAGKRALSAELNAILDRTSKWLPSVAAGMDRQGRRGRRSKKR